MTVARANPDRAMWGMGPTLGPSGGSRHAVAVVRGEADHAEA